VSYETMRRLLLGSLPMVSTALTIAVVFSWVPGLTPVTYPSSPGRTAEATLVPPGLPTREPRIASGGSSAGVESVPPVLPARDPRPEAAVELPDNMPEEWHSGGDYTLRVQRTRIALPGAAEDGGPEEAEMITYNGRLVGPTIRVRRGTTLKINLINELPTTGAPAVKVDPEQDDQPHDLFTTNLHTHGLHVSPEGDSDNIFREVPPGASFQYTYTIPADHPSGTFWYHPHKHGSVAYQMANGMAGALIVEGNGAAGKVQDLEAIPEIASARERILVLQQLILGQENGVGWVDPNDVYQEPPNPSAYCTTAINGIVMPTFTMHPKEVERWRFIHAGREGRLLLGWYNKRGGRLRNIPFFEISVDGLATGKLTARRGFSLYPGDRMDVLIKAPGGSGTYYLCARQEDESVPGQERLILKHLAKLVVQGAERDMNLPVPAQLVRCRPFEPIDAAECKVKRDIVLDYDDAKKFFHINDISFSKQAGLDRPALGGAEEWTLTAANTAPSALEPHPLHIHVNPFYLVRVENVATRAVTQLDEWHDTYLLEKGQKLTIRMRFRDFAGKTVLHCHTLVHEDQGMMRTIRIVDPERPDADLDRAPRLTECFVPAPTLSLPASRNSTWELSALGPRNVILVFFRGMWCSHCVVELRSLLQEARDLAGSGLTLVAVSGAPIEDPERATQSLEVPAGLAFQLLVDEDQRAFRRFGCYDDGPQHGLFVIDESGTIRARYVGDVPFADARAVCARVRELLVRGPDGPP
jgi:FtsP/CotA-like multicopper oxidase with cupredoxin domain/peroxiredoxin